MRIICKSTPEVAPVLRFTHPRMLHAQIHTCTWVHCSLSKCILYWSSHLKLFLHCTSLARVLCFALTLASRLIWSLSLGVKMRSVACRMAQKEVQVSRMSQRQENTCGGGAGVACPHPYTLHMNTQHAHTHAYMHIYTHLSPHTRLSPQHALTEGMEKKSCPCSVATKCSWDNLMLSKSSVEVMLPRRRENWDSNTSTFMQHGSHMIITWHDGHMKYHMIVTWISHDNDMLNH